jgi:hypothetical protein
MYRKRGRRLDEVAPTYPERYVHQADERRNFDQRANNSDERLSRFQAKDRYRHGNRQFEIVPGSGEGKRDGLCVVRAKPLAHPEAHQEHEEKVDNQRETGRRSSLRPAEASQ